MAVRTQAVQVMIRGLVLAALLVGFLAAAQIPGRDPLTPQEADQVRNTAGELNRRIPLLLRFAQERVTRFARVRRQPRSAPGRSARMYALLRQYQEILPELNDAMDELAANPRPPGGPKYNVRKILDPVIATEQHLATVLQNIQQSSSAADLATYRFELQNCLDATRDSLQNAEQDRGGARP
ncbi:MAG: hypothetical protein ACRD1Y_14865 [Terriglobales bacterium]